MHRRARIAICVAEALQRAVELAAGDAPQAVVRVLLAPEPERPAALALPGGELVAQPAGDDDAERRADNRDPGQAVPIRRIGAPR